MSNIHLNKRRRRKTTRSPLYLYVGW